MSRASSHGYPPISERKHRWLYTRCAAAVVWSLAVCTALLAGCSGEPDGRDAAAETADVPAAEAGADANSDADPTLPDSGMDVTDVAETGAEPCGGCAAGQYCALLPGCDGPPQYECRLNTCGDAICFLYCACDGQMFCSAAGGCAPTTQRYRASCDAP